MSTIETLTAKRDALQKECADLADAMPKDENTGFRRRGPLSHALNTKLAELAQCKAQLGAMRRGQKRETPRGARASTAVEADIISLQERMDHTRSKLRLLAAERDAALQVEAVAQLGEEKRAALLIALQAIESKEKFGKLGG